MQCPHCGRESDPLFKFCLHCGRDLTGAAPAPKPAPKPEPAPEPLDRISATYPVPDPPVETPDVADSAVPEDESTPAVAVTPDIDGEVSETVVPAGEADDDDSGERCSKCKAKLQEGASVCHLCGQAVGVEAAAEEISESTDVPGGEADDATVGFLVTIDTSSGKEAARLNLMDGTNSLGRRNCDVVFANDDLLSPHHVDIEVDGSGVHLACPISLNGTFIRIDGQAKLEHGDSFRLGQQLLRFEEMRFVDALVPEPDDGTRVMGSPTPSVVWGRLSQVVTPRLTASTFLLTGEQVKIGREKGDITFPGDRYMSGSHSVVIRRSDGYYLKDQGSSNGTFIRIKGRQALPQDRYFLAGRQLFRFERVA